MGEEMLNLAQTELEEYGYSQTFKEYILQITNTHNNLLISELAQVISQYLQLNENNCDTLKDGIMQIELENEVRILAQIVIASKDVNANKFFALNVPSAISKEHEAIVANYGSASDIIEFATEARQTDFNNLYKAIQAKGNSQEIEYFTNTFIKKTQQKHISEIYEEIVK